MALRRFLTIAVTTFAVLAWMGLGGLASANAASSSGASVASVHLGSASAVTGAGRTAPLAPSTGGSSAGLLTGSSNPGAEMAARALAATQAAGLKPYVAYVPHPSATPAEVAQAAATGAAAPLYTGDPAPMGLADYGLGVGGYVYVANRGSDTVSVMNGATSVVVATIGVGSQPYGLAYDSANREVYVANYGSNSVSVINTTSEAVVGTIPVGTEPIGVAYDPLNNEVYVTNYLTSNVTVLSGVTNHAVANVQVENGTYGVVVATYPGYVYVSNQLSATLSVINSTNSVIATVAVGLGPSGLAYDPINGTVYVANLGSDTVSVVGAASHIVGATITVGYDAYSLAYDSGNGLVYVGNLGLDNVSVIQVGLNRVIATVGVGFETLAVAYDSGNGDVYVAGEEGQGEVAIINPASPGVVVKTVGNEPSGLAYVGGVGAASSVPSIVNTTSLAGYVDISATGIQGQDLYQSSPDGFAIQMNAVLTNISLFSVPGYAFWAQDVVTYFPSTGYMYLISNIWNFSAPNDTVNNATIFAHGPYGTNMYGTLGYYYSVYNVTHPETYPFNVTLAMSSTITGGRDNVTFSAAVSCLSNPSDDFYLPNFDWVVFNSTSPHAPGGGPPPLPSNFTASGFGYNNVGLADDFELVVTGPGGASQVDLSSADASLALTYLVQSGGNETYVDIPSAYNYGSDTGETSIGANVDWSDVGPGSPGGFAPYATMTTGPSILSGLWGNGAPEGSDSLAVIVHPANAFNFVLYEGGANSPFPVVSQYDFAPTLETDLLNLMPGSYLVLTELADHSEVVSSLTLTHAQGLNVTLSVVPSLGLYTPLWAFSNAQIPAISMSGAGTPSNPYLLYNNQPAPLSPLYGLYNDYGFPVFPGVFLKGTTASVELNNSSQFQTYTNTTQSEGGYLPPSNDLQLWFWGVSNVSIHNATNISGWFALAGFFPLTFNSFNVIFYASEDNLVANNVFLTESQALLLYAGGTQFDSENFAGGNNTVWGNRFYQIDPPLNACPAYVAGKVNCTELFPYNSGLGLELGEGYDLIYNNLVATPTTAWELPLNLYSGWPEMYLHNVWNITPQTASTVHYAAGFPTIPLSGSVVGTATQGGNSWWDYGVALNWANGADNPTVALPYDENASNLIDPLPGYGSPLPGYSCLKYYCKTYIYSGGDAAPLPTAAATVSLGPHGVVGGTTWGAIVACEPTLAFPGTGPPGCACEPTLAFPGTGPPGCGRDPPALIFGQFETKASVAHFVLPDGPFNWTPIVPAGYTSSTGGSFVVTNGAPVTVTVPYAPPGNAVLTFSESGLPAGLTWQVTVAGSPLSLTTDGGTDSLSFTEAIGSSYAYTVSDIAGWHQSTLPYAGTVSVTTAPTTEPTLVYTQVAYPVTFSESGLPSGLTWSVTFNSVGASLTTNGGTDTLSFVADPNGSYSYVIATVPGYVQSTIPSSGTETVSGAPLAVSVSYAPTTHAVTFSESGLPSGLTWTVTFNGVTMSLTTNGGTDTLSFASVPNGVYSYTISGNPGYHESTVPYTGTVTVNGAPLAVSVTYTRVTYPVTFSETGLPSGLTWQVTFNGVTMSLTTNGGTDTLTFASEPNGTYSYAIATNAGYHESTVPYAGNEAISGAPLHVSVTYVQVTYSVTFYEGGLPAGLTWKVTVNGVAKSLTTNGLIDSLTWTGLPNGTYSYSIAGNPGWHEVTVPYSGTFTVNGASLIGVLAYLQVTYSVTFSESGLPAGLTWQVTVNGVTKSLKTNGGTDSLTWSGLANGTYAYSIAAISGWHQSTLPSSGSLIVNGASVTEPTLKYVA